MESLATSLIVAGHGKPQETDVAKRPHLKTRWVEQRKHLQRTKNQKGRWKNEYNNNDQIKSMSDFNE